MDTIGRISYHDPDDCGYHIEVEQYCTRCGINGNRKFIAVEGPIGVGKTPLACRIAAHFGGTLVLESPGDNPFLERYYKQPSQFALQTQLFFLFQRIRKLKELSQDDLFASIRITDFMLAKDPIFAELTLEPDEYELYENIYQQLAVQIPVPDLVIYLQASVDVLAKRIRSRGMLYERNMKRAQLSRLTEAYTRYFMNYKESTLIVVNADKPGLLGSATHFDLLMERIGSISSGRHYFNPVD